MSFICYFVNIFLQLLFFFTYHIFLYVYILLFGKGLFEGTEMGNNAIFTYFLYTSNGICSIKVYGMNNWWSCQKFLRNYTNTKIRHRS